MTEEIDGVPTTTAAAPQCTGSLGWVYNEGYCYMFTSYHVDYLKAEELCNQEGAYLADVLNQNENNFIKSVLNVVNPKDGTDYWLGGLDADRNNGLQWMTGNFKNLEKSSSVCVYYLSFFINLYQQVIKD